MRTRSGPARDSDGNCARPCPAVAAFLALRMMLTRIAAPVLVDNDGAFRETRGQLHLGMARVLHSGVRHPRRVGQLHGFSEVRQAGVFLLHGDNFADMINVVLQQASSFRALLFSSTRSRSAVSNRRDQISLFMRSQEIRLLGVLGHQLGELGQAIER